MATLSAHPAGPPKASSLTEQIDAAIDAEGSDDSGHVAVAAGRAFLASIDSAALTPAQGI